MTTADGTAPKTYIGFDGVDMFIEEEGTRIAVRGHPGTPQAKKWIPLVHGVRVVDLDDDAIEIVFTNPSLTGALS